ncbi:MAG TPA: DNA-processing protein DprA [Tepidisphaeraceae bacterium]|nr:DNA-processing protein DprA [Tepidisphaeraceae bacterium]
MEQIELTGEELLGPLNEVEAKHAPKLLYASGDVGMLRHAARVSIVGSRKATAEGLRRAHKLASLLAAKGIVVVSGLAEGIDTAAHRAAIQAKGKTAAVIGTPLEQVYPKQNTELQHRLMQEQLADARVPRHLRPVTRCSNLPFEPDGHQPDQLARRRTSKVGAIAIRRQPTGSGTGAMSPPPSSA